jgi:secreted trypsin-like serine protease
MLKSLLTILIFTSGVFGLTGDEHTKIVGGELVKDIESACFIALITLRNRPHCGGSIITANHILTAAVNYL